MLLLLFYPTTVCYKIIAPKSTAVPTVLPLSNSKLSSKVSAFKNAVSHCCQVLTHGSLIF